MLLFADGVHGLMQKGERVSTLSKEFSISFMMKVVFPILQIEMGMF